jgi:hypothetical protein
MYCPTPSISLPCVLGQFCPARTSQPSPCTVGYVCPNVTTRLPCPVGPYCPLGSVTPTQCPTNFTTSISGASLVTDCICIAGHRKLGDGSCNACMERTYCPLNITTPLDCPLRTSSERGAKELSDCRCEYGYHGDAQSCQACDEGTHTMSLGALECAPCPDTLTLCAVCGSKKWDLSSVVTNTTVYRLCLQCARSERVCLPSNGLTISLNFLLGSIMSVIAMTIFSVTACLFAIERRRIGKLQTLSNPKETRNPQ